MCGLDACKLSWAMGPSLPPLRPERAIVRTADRVGVFHRLQDIRGIAGAADRHDHVSRFGEILQLFDKDAVVADVIGVCRNGGRESVSAMMRKRLSRWKLAPLTMSQTKCEAVDALPPLPQTKNAAVLIACALEDVDGLADLLQVDSIDGPSERRLYTVRENSRSIAH
jgi:hypothetical protein